MGEEDKVTGTIQYEILVQESNGQCRIHSKWITYSLLLRVLDWIVYRDYYLQVWIRKIED